MKKNKSIDAYEAEENFKASQSYENALDEYMEGEGYKWCRDAQEWIDDGSLADMAADHEFERQRDDRLTEKAAL